MTYDILIHINETFVVLHAQKMNLFMRVPIQAGEFDVEALAKLIPDPVH